MDSTYYALHVRSCAEGVVEDALRFAGIVSFWPNAVTKDSRGRLLRRPWFPGYVFSDLPRLEEQRHTVLRIPQVLRLVGVGDEPAAIPEIEIESVRKVADFAARLKAAAAPARLVAEGERVTIKHGPLRGVSGIAIYAKNATRIIVGITMLNQAVSAEVDATWLAKAAA